MKVTFKFECLVYDKENQGKYLVMKVVSLIFIDSLKCKMLVMRKTLSFWKS